MTLSGCWYCSIWKTVYYYHPNIYTISLWKDKFNTVTTKYNISQFGLVYGLVHLTRMFPSDYSNIDILDQFIEHMCRFTHRSNYLLVADHIIRNAPMSWVCKLAARDVIRRTGLISNVIYNSNYTPSFLSVAIKLLPPPSDVLQWIQDNMSDHQFEFSLRVLANDPSLPLCDNTFSMMFYLNMYDQLNQLSNGRKYIYYTTTDQNIPDDILLYTKLTTLICEYKSQSQLEKYPLHTIASGYVPKNIKDSMYDYDDAMNIIDGIINQPKQLLCLLYHTPLIEVAEYVQLILRNDLVDMVIIGKGAALLYIKQHPDTSIVIRTSPYISPDALQVLTNYYVN